MNERMNQYQHQLFKDLEQLTNQKLKKNFQVFTSKDHEFNGSVYRIYNYQLAKYTDFCQPNGLECRGHMFEVDQVGGDPIRLASLPPPKFFNINENPFTENLDFTNPKQVMVKEDGSLISTFMHNSEVFLKSKASLTSSQATESLKFLNRPENKQFKDELQRLENLGYTINLEYVGPQNRVVLPYKTENLVVLSIRNRMNGEYLEKKHLNEHQYPETLIRWVKQFEIEDSASFMNSYKSDKDIEGYVIQLASGQFCKAKTDWYFARHGLRSSSEGKKLYHSVLDECADDLRALFYGDKLSIDRIDYFENTVLEILTDCKRRMENFYSNNLDLIATLLECDGKEVLRRVKKEWYFRACDEFEEGWLKNIAIKRMETQINDEMWRTFLRSAWKELEYKFVV